MAYIYMLTLTDNTHKENVYVSNLFLRIINTMSGIVKSIYGIVANSKPHIHAIIITEKPIKYTYIVSRVPKGNHIHIQRLYTHQSVRNVLAYIESHKGEIFNVNFNKEYYFPNKSHQSKRLNTMSDTHCIEVSRMVEPGKKILVIMNHQPTEQQISDLRNMGFTEIEVVKHPEIPPDADSIRVYEIFKETIKGKEFDALWVQGDFRFFAQALLYSIAWGIPLFVSTTKRIAEEKRNPDGSVELKHVFKHVRFVRVH